MKTQRTFFIGDDWLYYKIYCGTKTTDFLLSTRIKPLIFELKQSGLVDNWFFIRYQDPEHHLRLRFKCVNIQKIGEIITRVNRQLKDLVEQDLVWKIQTDTYHRELERYGSKTIELAEELFHHESEMIVNFIDLLTEGTEGDELRWMFSLRGIDSFLNDFEFSLQSKMKLMSWLKSDFAIEFHSDKHLKKQVNDRYRKYRQKIDSFMALTHETANEYAPLIALIDERSNKIKVSSHHILDIQSKGKLEMDINELMASYIHMFMNRLFKSKNRIHEMIGYDFLFRYYMAQISINNNNIT